MRSKSLVQEGLIVKKDGNLSEIYDVERIVGQGSISTISLVRKKRVASFYRKKHPCNQFWRLCGKSRSSDELTSTTVSGRNYALKTIDLRNVDKFFIFELENEIDVLRTIDHPNIVKAYEVYEWKRSIGIIMELCSGGDLYSRRPYTEAQAALIMKQLVSAVAYMHDKNIIHRDIKFENVMFENKGKKAAVKLIDFGLSKKYLKKEHLMTEMVGTIYSMAPEVLSGGYGAKADVWSLGVVAYGLLCGSFPFWGKSRAQIKFKIHKEVLTYKGREWAHISEAGKQFVNSLLVRDTQKRLSAKEARNNKWFQENIKHVILDSIDKDQFQKGFSNFAITGEMKKLIMTVIAYKSSPEDILNLREVFNNIDTKNTGFISKEEFKDAFKESNYSDEELKSMFHAADMGKDGKINYTEFLAATFETQGSITKKTLAEAFDRIDSDDTGFISKKNLEEILGTTYSPGYIEKIIKEADSDNDGKISYDDFMTAFYSEKNKEIGKLSESILEQFSN